MLHIPIHNNNHGIIRKKRHKSAYHLINVTILTFHNTLTPPLTQAESQLTVLAALVSMFSPKGGNKSHTGSIMLA